MARTDLSRRDLLRAAGLAGAAAPLAGLGTGVWAQSAAAQPIPIRLSWNATAVCVSPIPVAVTQGFFQKHNLDVELINFAGSTDQLLEAIATGKTDAGVGMIHRWLKALEQGFDVKLTASLHGGCSRLVGSKAAGVTTLESLRGKAIGVSDMASPGKNFFAIYLTKHGIDPEREVTWRQYPANLLGLAVEKGEIQAIADGDPNLYLLQKTQPDLVEIATNLSGEYRERVCCVLGIGGALIRDNRPAAAGLSRALLEASDWVLANPEAAALICTSIAPKTGVEDLQAILNTMTYAHHPAGKELEREVALYADDLKLVNVLRPSTDSAAFAAAVTADVLS
ncbi:ABC transporter substrate-binding protein [Inquilinus limosus]|uniref:ABC transporter substrate-binding protein n=1 Tax=Inquilinus limosus TaxID=171674 RepID=UPI0004274C2A|nr:ABC transporter substrate-binding protein [Inquilinus limosus]